jgi:murein DD-endopeptidase MepM/ murein hydrolase activator NlpD
MTKYRSILVASVGSLLLTMVFVPTRASADTSSDQAQITQLESQIAQDGVHVQALVAGYDQALSQEAIDTQRLDAAQAHLAADQQNENQAMAVLRNLALSSYMSNNVDNSSLAIFATGSGTAVAATAEYTQIADAGLRNAVDAVAADARQTQASENQLRAAQAQAQATVAQLGADKAAAQAALAQDDALLAQVKGNLATLLAQAAQQRAEAQARAEAALAAEQAAAAANPVNVSFNPQPGSYTNPLRSINGLSPERVDQGVDYSGYGPIYAVGNGKVLSTTNSGWPGGTFIAYKLLDGPAAGLVVYAAEDIEPTVSVGQTVNAGTVLGTMYEGPDGIETGWADPSGDGNTMARDDGQFNGSNSTAFGANFSQLLASLGAPPGVMQNEPPTGSLPPGWPTW